MNYAHADSTAAAYPANHNGISPDHKQVGWLARRLLRTSTSVYLLAGAQRYQLCYSRVCE